MNEIGFWKEDASGLPCFEYTGRLPYTAPVDKGQQIKLPDDPWFLLGNYRLTLFSHVSGRYELISSQRAWVRLNGGERSNSAAISIDDKEYALAGPDSLAADPDKCHRTHGCGTAEFLYDIDGVTISRNISVKPSSDPYNGASAFLLTVTVKNESDSERRIVFNETVYAEFSEIHWHGKPVRYEYKFRKENHTGIIGIKAVSDDPLLFPDRETMSVCDGFPPELFARSLSDTANVTGNDRELSLTFDKTLGAGEEATFRAIVGFVYDGVDEVCEELGTYGFSEEWKRVLPSFADEKDSELRRELIWHAYTLEAMATYSEYYGETKIPQGIIYDYYWGQHASARDNFQHALPLVYYNKRLAKSVLRYMLKRTTPYGEIRLIEYGNGYAANEEYFTSDQQLYFFLYLSEYLRVTKDYDVLREMITPYPAKGMSEMPVYELVGKCFVFLRDTIGTGEHGLVRLLNSDWNDAVYYIVEAPYNRVFRNGESHMNSAMAISILQTLIPQLEAAKIPELMPLCESMRLYRKKQLSAFLADMGERPFPRRMYFNGKPYGDDNMFLEPQGFTLQIAELPEERKRTLYGEMLKRVYDGERIGAREQQTPEFEDDGFDKGSRENGGFWYALNGPVIIGVSTFDKVEARSLLMKMTLKNLSEQYPKYWSSYWSAPDTLESSLIPGEGCVDQSDDFWKQPVYCAHPHAWILYCYYRLNE